MAQTEFHKTHLAFFQELNILYHNQLASPVQAFAESKVGNTRQDAEGVEQMINALCEEFPALISNEATRKLCRAWLQEVTLSQIALANAPLRARKA